MEKETTSPSGYLIVYCSGLMLLVGMKKRDQEGDIWALKMGGGASGPGSPEAKGKGLHAGMGTS